MVITIICIVFLAISCFIPILKQAADKVGETKRTTGYKTSEPFNLSEYYDRTKQQHESLLAEKYNQDPYVIILWWNNNGLRLNDDGSFEWIRKNYKPVSISYQPQQSVTRQIDDGTRELNAQIQAGINQLHYEIARQQMQAAQIRQTQNIINSLQAAPYPPYPQYIRCPAQYGINQYTPSLWGRCQGNYIQR